MYVKFIRSARLFSISLTIYGSYELTCTSPRTYGKLQSSTSAHLQDQRLR